MKVIVLYGYSATWATKEGRGRGSAGGGGGYLISDSLPGSPVNSAGTFGGGARFVTDAPQTDNSPLEGAAEDDYEAEGAGNMWGRSQVGVIGGFGWESDDRDPRSPKCEGPGAPGLSSHSTQRPAHRDKATMNGAQLLLRR
jgi:hypothetical protein